MRVEWFGQSAFSLESDGVTVFIDPFGDMSPMRSARRWDYPDIEGVEALSNGDTPMVVVPAAP